MYPAQAFIDELRRERRRIRRALHPLHPRILHWLRRARATIRRRAVMMMNERARFSVMEFYGSVLYRH